MSNVSAADGENSAVNPKPQEMNRTGKGFPLTPKVGVIAGEATDEQAVDEVISVLEGADVKSIIRKNPGEKVNTPVTIFIDGPSENEECANALKKHGWKEPEELANEGNVPLAYKKNKQIVLGGKDKSGSF